jgi:hypothetical protein
MCASPTGHQVLTCPCTDGPTVEALCLAGDTQADYHSTGMTKGEFWGVTGTAIGTVVALLCLVVAIMQYRKHHPQGP